MFLNTNYVLSNELTLRMQIKTSNISMLVKRLEEAEDFATAVKMGNCTFIDKTSINLPNYIKEGLKDTFTDMSHCLPYTFIKREFKINDKDIDNLKRTGLIIGEQIIANKRLMTFSDSFIEETRDCVIYPLYRTELQECLDQKAIDGYVDISNTRVLSWYKINPMSTLPSTGF